MTYKVLVHKEVWIKHREIARYCLDNFGNRKFAEELHKDILRTIDRLGNSPFMYQKINNTYKVILIGKCTLYYYVEKNYVYIECLKGRGQA